LEIVGDRVFDRERWVSHGGIMDQSVDKCNNVETSRKGEFE